MNPNRTVERPELLHVDDLRAEYRTHGGGVQVVRGVDLDLAPREKAAIVGESGSGKSAFALSVLGLLKPPGRVTGGRVGLGGVDITSRLKRGGKGLLGADLAFVYQDPLTALDPLRTIGSQLAEAIRAHAPRLRKAQLRQRAIELLQEVEVVRPAERIDDYPHQFSGGMRQRVVLAMALANDPLVLVADEPTTALDVTTQAQILDLLDLLVERRGTAVLLITHDLGVVARFCDTVHVMYAGQIVESGPAEQLFADPLHPYTQGLLRAALRPGTRSSGRHLPVIGGQPPDLARLGAGCAFAPRCPLAAGLPVCATTRPELLGVAVGRAARCHAVHGERGRP